MNDTTGPIARLARVSVHTLHHDGHIGWLHPRVHQKASYRLCPIQDRVRLQRLLDDRLPWFHSESAQNAALSESERREQPCPNLS